jgi:hypothetical protein
MSLQDVETLGYAVITDMRGRAGDKAIHLASIPAAKRACERRPEQTTDPRQSRAGSQIGHVRGSLSTIRPGKALRQRPPRRNSAINLKVWSQ